MSASSGTDGRAQGVGHEDRSLDAVPYQVDEPISPELVLVDPELAARLRLLVFVELLLDTRPPYAEREDRPVATERSNQEALGRYTPGPAPARRVPVGRILILAVLVALLGVAFLPPRDAPRFAEPPVSTAGPMLTWRPAADSNYYLLELFAGQRLVHAKTLTTTNSNAPAWLAPGRYTWRVYAGQGSPGAREVRGPLEDGWFTIDP